MSRFKNRRGFTLIELLIVTVILGILALGSVPLISANTRDARRAEGEALLGSMKTQARIGYVKLTKSPGKLSDLDIKAKDRNAKYFKVQNKVKSGKNGYDARLTAVAIDSDDGKAHMDFNWAGGDSSIVWK